MHKCRALGREDGFNLKEPVGPPAAIDPCGLVRLRVQSHPARWPTSAGLKGDIFPERGRWDGGAQAKGSQWVWCCGFAAATVFHD